MQRHDQNQNGIVDVNLFVPGLSVFEGVADGIVLICARLAGLVRMMAAGLGSIVR